MEKSINYLFEGHTESYVQCKDVDVRSTKRESFMDIQLVVKVGRGRGRRGEHVCGTRVHSRGLSKYACCQHLALRQRSCLIVCNPGLPGRVRVV